MPGPSLNQAIISSPYIWYDLCPKYNMDTGTRIIGGPQGRQE